MASASSDATISSNIAVEIDVSSASLSAAGIKDLLEKSSNQQSDIHGLLLLLEARLRDATAPCDQDTAQQIWIWVLHNVFGTTFLSGNYSTPSNGQTWHDTLDAHSSRENNNRDALYRTALYALTEIAEQHPHLLKELKPGQISALIICSTTSATDLSLGIKAAADKLLLKVQQQRSAASSRNSPTLATVLLEQVVRPSFARSRSQNITTAGRKAIDPLPQAFTASEDDGILKPWKYDQTYVIAVLKWVLDNSSTQEIESNWHLIAPPVLTLIDDEATTSKVHGCSLLQILLVKVSGSTWTRTGLGKVFETALTPALAYLPPLTDQEEAEKLIASIYPTLISLSKYQFSSPEQHAKKLAMLDNLLRAGVLSGLSHIGENVKISILLLNQLCVVLPEMGIYCIKHLKPTVAVLVGYLCDPFAFASTALLHSTLKALQCLITNAWPRMDRYSGEIFRGIAVCWQRLSQEPSTEPVSNVQGELRITLQLLMRTLDGHDTGLEILNIIEKDEILSTLLP